jgi:hypothetical protein
MRLPTREDQERFKCQDREKLKVIKKYAEKELAEINKHNFPLAPYYEQRAKFLTFVLESERFAGLPLESFPEEAIKEIHRLPFMEDTIDTPANKWDDATVDTAINDTFCHAVEIGKKEGLREGLYENIKQKSISGKRGGSRKTRLQGIVAATKKYKTENVDHSFGKFWKFISHSKYTKNSPYKIDGYSLYVEGDDLFHKDEIKKTKKGKIKSRWISRPKKTIERYFYEYSNEITPQ